MNEDDQLPSDQAQVEKLLTFIRHDWFSVRSNWLFIGQCIFNIFGRNDGIELFRRYTGQEFFIDLEHIWRSYEKGRHGVSAIRHLARQCKPDEYYEWVGDQILRAAYIACMPTSGMTEIADICKFMFGDQFICASSK